jgi:large subunit ribosomal protein L29
MKLEEIRTLSDADLAQEIVNQHEEWRNLRFQNALGRLTTFHQLREVRKAIARLKTIQREREIAADPVAHYAGNDQVRARRRAEKADEKVTKRKYARAQAGRTTRRRRYEVVAR